MKEKQGVDVVTAALTSVRNALQKPETVHDLRRPLLTSRPWFEQPDPLPKKRRTITQISRVRLPATMFSVSLYRFFFQAEDGIRDVERSRGLGDVYKRQALTLSPLLLLLFATLFRSRKLYMT